MSDVAFDVGFHRSLLVVGYRPFSASRGPSAAQRYAQNGPTVTPCHERRPSSKLGLGSGASRHRQICFHHSPRSTRTWARHEITPGTTPRTATACVATGSRGVHAVGHRVRVIRVARLRRDGPGRRPPTSRGCRGSGAIGCHARPAGARVDTGIRAEHVADPGASSVDHLRENLPRRRCGSPLERSTGSSRCNGRKPSREAPDARPER